MGCHALPNVLRFQLVLHMAYVMLLRPAELWLIVTPEFNDYNLALFTIRARALNNLVYWTSQILGSVSIGFLLDQTRLTRRFRAFAGWCVLFVMVFVVHIWAYFYQRYAAYFCAAQQHPTSHALCI